MWFAEYLIPLLRPVGWKKSIYFKLLLLIDHASNHPSFDGDAL
jgi:hypothetical protein